MHIEILPGKLLEQAPSLRIHQNVCKCQSNRIPANKWLWTLFQWHIYMYKAWVVVKKNPANIHVPKKPSRFEYLTMTKSSYLIYNTCILI